MKWKKRALVEMQRFEEKIKFENLLSKADAISPEKIEEEMRDKVHELTQEYREKVPIKNVLQI